MQGWTEEPMCEWGRELGAGHSVPGLGLGSEAATIPQTEMRVGGETVKTEMLSGMLPSDLEE